MVLASRWNSFEDKYCCPYILDPTDPLFKVIGKLYIEEVGIRTLCGVEILNELFFNSTITLKYLKIHLYAKLVTFTEQLVV